MTTKPLDPAFVPPVWFGVLYGVVTYSAGAAAVLAVAYGLDALGVSPYAIAMVAAALFGAWRGARAVRILRRDPATCAAIAAAVGVGAPNPDGA